MTAEDDDVVYHVVEGWRSLRQTGASEHDIIRRIGLAGVKETLFAYWQRFDPSSTVSGDAVAKLFPTLADRWERAA